MPKKLSDENKQEILKLYRESAETTSTLADRYQVSSSTISRFLKTNLSTSEYEELIQQKRMNRTPNRILESEEEFQPELVAATSAVSPSNIPSLFTVEKEKTIVEEEKTIVEEEKIIPTPILVEEKTIPTPILKEKRISPPVKAVEAYEQLDLFPENDGDAQEDEELVQVDVMALQELLGEELGDLNEDEDDLEEEDEDEWEEEPSQPFTPRSLSSNSDFQVLPLSKASLPNICYVVIDRAAELIVRPLREFGDLGRIPPEEVQQKTLPVFDNHRVARRFSNRSQRVIKVPDGRLLQKTSSYLQAKGITRLLLDGRVYSF